MPSLDTIGARCLTMDEAANQLHKSRRWLQDFLRDNPDCYFPAGRTKLIDQEDFERIKSRIAAAESVEVEIYFIRVLDFIKIGITTRGKKRLSAYKTSTPFDLDVLFSYRGPKSEEARLHKKFAWLHHRGEWFRAEPELIHYINRRKGAALARG